MNMASWQRISIRLLAALLVCLALFPLVRWAVWDAAFFPITPESCSLINSEGSEESIRGACWPVVFDTLPLLLFGRYPAEEYWRLIFAVVAFMGGNFIALKGQFLQLKLTARVRFSTTIATLALCTILLRGWSDIGLTPIESHLWGGLMLTLVLSVIGISAGSVLGLILALARRSLSPVPRILATSYIEVIRGVPLITVLFFANYLLPLFLPASMSDMSEFSRAAWAIVLFEAAYIAEVLRAGLGAVDPGQIEAAKALGLNKFQRGRLIVLPQALRISTPALISTTVGLVKDTSLVAIIGIYDLLGAARNVPSIPEWIGHDLEPLLFAALFYIFLCLVLDQAAKKYELRQN